MLAAASNNLTASSSLGGVLPADALPGNGPAVPPRPAAQLQAPKPVLSPAPSYPPIALSQHIQGTVVIDALVDATGNVTSMKVISGPPLLYQAALDALRKWKYEPAKRDGQPIATHTQINVRFQLP